MTHFIFGSGVRRGPAPGGAGPRSRQAPPRRWPLALAAAVASAVLLMGAPATALASTPTPTPEPSQPTIVLSPLSHGVVAPGAALTATIEITNPTDAPLPPSSVSIQLGEAPLTSVADLDAWIEEGSTSGDLNVIDRPAMPEVAPTESAIAVSTVAPEALAGRPAGVYALSSSYGRGLVARSAVVLQADGGAGAPVGLVVAITASPQSAGLLTADQLTSLTGVDGRLTSLLATVSGTSAILAVDPAILASIRVLGESAPATAQAWLARLAALPNERFALQFGDADVAAQIDAGLPALLQPTSLAYAMSAENFAEPTQTPEPTLSPTPGGDQPEQEPTVPVEPDLPELLAVPGARAALYWPADGRASASAIGALSQQPSASGVAAGILVSSDATDRADRRAAARTPEGASLLVYEAGTSRAIRSTAAATADSAQASTAVISAHLALETAGAAGPLLVTSDRLAELNPTSLRAAIDTIYSYPGIVPATLSTFLSAEQGTAQSTAEADQDAAGQLQDLLAGEEAIAKFAPIIDEPVLLTGPERASILQLLGAGWRDEADLWKNALAAHAEATSTTLTSVAVQQPDTIQLVSPEAGLPFFIRNDLPFAANVVLVSTPDNLRLDVERTKEVRAEPGVNTRVEVPVRARVGSGEVTIELRLLSPTYEQVGPLQQARVTVRAEWERIGIIALGSIVVLLLSAGLVRTVRRRRRARDAASAEAADTEHASDPRAEADE